jgi:hypothetical protein
MPPVISPDAVATTFFPKNINTRDPRDSRPDNFNPLITKYLGVPCYPAYSASATSLKHEIHARLPLCKTVGGPHNPPGQKQKNKLPVRRGTTWQPICLAYTELTDCVAASSSLPSI